MKFKYIVLFFIAFQVSLQAQFVEQTTTPVNLQNGGSEEQSNPEIDRVISIVNSVEGKNNFIDQLNPDSNVSLPFGIIKQIGATRYTIAIDSIKFLPQGAYFSAFAAIDFPGTLKKLASGVLKGMQEEIKPENAWHTTLYWNPDGTAGIEKNKKSAAKKGSATSNFIIKPVSLNYLTARTLLLDHHFFRNSSIVIAIYF